MGESRFWVLALFLTPGSFESSDSLFEELLTFKVPGSDFFQLGKAPTQNYDSEVSRSRLAVCRILCLSSKWRRERTDIFKSSAARV